MRLTKERADAIVRRYRPKGWRVRWRSDDKLEPAHADNDLKEILSPLPYTREGLYVFLHECAHVILKHWDESIDLPEWKYEFEAEQWAIATMRREGYAVPRGMLAAGRKYVKKCLAVAEPEEKKRVPRHVLKFAGVRKNGRKP